MNHNLPLISIVVITYNSSEFVLETLDSCKLQTYENLELIITDDASTDNTIRLCENWLDKNKSRFKRTKIVEAPKNTGLSANFNRGVKEVKGTWFKPIPGDDLLLDNCIIDNVARINEIDEPNIGVVYSRKNNIIKLSDYNKDSIPADIKNKPSIFYLSPKISVEEQYQLALRRVNPAIVSWVVNTQYFINVGGCDESIAMHDDGPLLLRLLKGGYKYVFLNKITVLYRKNPNSITNTNLGKVLYRKWILEMYFKTVKKYIYPNVSFIEQITINYKIAVANIFVKLNLNKNLLVLKLLNRLLLLPAIFITNSYKKKWISYTQKKYN